MGVAVAITANLVPQQLAAAATGGTWDGEIRAEFAPEPGSAIVSTEEIVASIWLEYIGAQARGNGASTAVSKELEKGIHR